ncbi:type II secretion system F family protein [Nocardioides sp. URHA0020]|uniref:type II secretion system F family protein n=1 Tax=Nocardioides sp. URHA0020 TaxID=1380392 RepID=UPI00048B7996|nr:type II secretion system F family protein [Nocardioides sp. URHA0020]
MTSSSAVLVVLLAAAATALLVRPSAHLPTASAPTTAAPDADAGPGWLHRHRMVWSGLAGLAALLFVSGPMGLPVGVVGAVVAWVVIGRAEPAAVRARRRAVARDLPHVVALLAAALRAGAAPAEAIDQVCRALPGPATDRLAGIAARLSLGLDPAEVWSSLADEPGLVGLGRTLARAHATGAPVVTAVERLADELARAGRAESEERARAVGVQAAVPLGLCLLPAFVLIGIVPLVVALLTSLDL